MSEEMDENLTKSGTFDLNRKEIEEWCRKENSKGIFMNDEPVKDTSYFQEQALEVMKNLLPKPADEKQLWDFFAAHTPMEHFALKFESSEDHRLFGEDFSTNKNRYEAIALCSADYADAMLKERKKRFGDL